MRPPYRSKLQGFTHWLWENLIRKTLIIAGMAILMLARGATPQVSPAPAGQAGGSGSTRDDARAEKTYRERLASSPGDPALLLRLGIALQRQSKNEESIAVFQEILQRAPMYPETNLYLGNAYFAANRFDEAIAAFQKELTGNPTEKRARFNLALAYSVQGKHFEAIQQLQTLLTQDPGNPAYLYQLATIYKTATRKTAERLAESNPDSAFTHALQGEAFADAERFDQAVLEYEEVLRKDPSFPGIQLAIGEVYWRQKAYPQAQPHLELALQEDPNQPLANYYMGDTLVTQSAYARAVPHLKIIIAAYPRVARAYFLLGKCYMSAGELPKAREVFNKALELDPKYQEVHYQLHLLHARLGNKAESQKELELVKKLQLEDAREMKDNTQKAISRTPNP